MSLHLTPLPATRFEAWATTARQRLIDRNRESGRRLGADAVGHVEQVFGDLFPEGGATSTTRVMRIVDDADGELGTLVLALSGQKMLLLDLDLDLDLDVDLGGAETLSDAQNEGLLALLLPIARDMGATQIGAQLFPQDTAGWVFAEQGGFEVASIQMVLEPLPVRDLASRVEVSPMTAERFPRFAAASEEGFAHDLVASGRYTSEEAIAESHRQMVEELPDGLDTEGQEFFTAAVDGTEVGILWFGMRRRDGRPQAFILDIEVAADQRRKGYGRALMHAAEREARRLGADSIGLHVFGFNTGAVDLYEQLGYRRTEESLLREV
ncbi:GNAT family N-acetyltransferase [Microbacterium sp. STF-2]|uniref:GNAT family N-acetyltransferase n=1 Tax=Microbacterium sp. STF-2 TaxID=3031132 RepID=UPI002B001357|nr:GNAT family N-acetyltransferase [Microbacterium sp. STF-2]MEA1264740.1 GNAT family N-acetyltransferase [Microbacterium sp. STF-2]